MVVALSTIGSALGVGTAATAGGAITGGVLAATATGAATVGLAGYGLMNLGKTPSQPSYSGGGYSSQPPALPAPPSVEAAETVAKESVENKRRAISRNRTIFTSAMGMSEEEKSGLSLKTLTGQ